MELAPTLGPALASHAIFLILILGQGRRQEFVPWGEHARGRPPEMDTLGSGLQLPQSVKTLSVLTLLLPLAPDTGHV